MAICLFKKSNKTGQTSARKTSAPKPSSIVPYFFKNLNSLVCVTYCCKNCISLMYSTAIFLLRVEQMNGYVLMC